MTTESITDVSELAVGETENVAISRMTIVVSGDESILEQVRKQLGKVIDTIKVTDFTGIDHVERDLMLIRIHAVAEKRSEVVELVNLFRGRVVDVARTSLLVELAGPEEKVEAFIELGDAVFDELDRRMLLAVLELDLGVLLLEVENDIRARHYVGDQRGGNRIVIAHADGEHVGVADRLNLGAAF